PLFGSRGMQWPELQAVEYTSVHFVKLMDQSGQRVRIPTGLQGFDQFLVYLDHYRPGLLAPETANFVAGYRADLGADRRPSGPPGPSAVPAKTTTDQPTAAPPVADPGAVPEPTPEQALRNTRVARAAWFGAVTTGPAFGLALLLWLGPLSLLFFLGMTVMRAVF